MTTPSLTRHSILRSAGLVMLTAFLYTCLVSFFIREILLPYILPGLHAGNGFLVGGDSSGFHEKAVLLAEKIRQQGWGSWELKPFVTNDTPAGLASAIYAILPPSPRWLMPFNAAIHALSATALFLILWQVLQNIRAAASGAALFVLMPTAAYWYSQLHKDGIYILGVYLFVAAWVIIADTSAATMARLLVSAVLYCLAIGLIWTVREYAIIVMLGASLIMTAPLCMLLLWRFRNHSLTWKDAIGRLALLAALLLSTSLLSTHGVSRSFYSSELAPPQSNTDEARKEHEEKDRSKFCDGWENTPGVPSSIENLAASLIQTRNGYFRSVYAGAGSTIDREYCIDSISSFLLYFPRAFQVAFFAPFPWQWLEEGAVGGRSARLIAGGEMLLFYALFFCTIAATWRARYNGLLWLVLLFCITMLILYAIVTPNIGALHRMRYGFLILFLSPGAGLVGALLFRAIRQYLPNKRMM